MNGMMNENLIVKEYEFNEPIIQNIDSIFLLQIVIINIFIHLIINVKIKLILQISLIMKQLIQQSPITIRVCMN